MNIWSGYCPHCHVFVRIPIAEEPHFNMYMPEDELKAKIKLLEESLADALALIEEHGSPVLKAHATRIMKIRRSLYGEGGLG